MNDIALETPPLLRFALQIHRERRRRKHAFAEYGPLFGEPAWDMLLCLFIASERGRALTISAVAKAIEVPLNTALRYVDDMEVRGLLVRVRDTRDSRRTFLHLSAEADEKMRAFLRRSEPMPRDPFR